MRVDLKIYGEPAAAAPERWWTRRWRAWREEFERWATPEAEPEAEAERSFVPVALLLGLALVVQYAQLALPGVRAYLIDRDPLYHSSWMVFTICKQWAFFVLMLVAFAIKEERLAGIGFPRLAFGRITLALLLVGFFLGAALLRAPSVAPGAVSTDWVVPAAPAERALVVLTALTAAIVEESFFRGFAIVWTYRWSGHLGLAVAFPAFVFAAGHAAFGWLNVIYAFLAALGLSGLFLWRRDLYWPMVVHFVLDVLVLLG